MFLGFYNKGTLFNSGCCPADDDDSDDAHCQLAWLSIINCIKNGPIYTCNFISIKFTKTKHHLSLNKSNHTQDQSKTIFSPKNHVSTIGTKSQ